MDVDEYRKAYAAEVEKAKASPEFASMSMAPATGSSEASGDGILRDIAVFRDSSQTRETRLAALRDVQTAKFMGPGFAPYRAMHRDALRAVASDDKDQDLRK